MSEWDSMGTILTFEASLVVQMVKNPPAGNPSCIPGQKDLLERGMATHSSILAWDIQRVGGRGRINWLHVDHSPWGRRVRHD